MNPLIRDDQPARLPHRGPLDAPAPANTPTAIQQLLEENAQLLLLAEEAMNGKIQGLTSEPADVKEAVPFLERLQRNLIYLALLADQKGMQQPFPTAAPQAGQWMPEEVQKLGEGLRLFGKAPDQLARHVGTKSAAEVAAALEQARI